MRKIFRINMRTKEIFEQKETNDEKMVGGRGFIVKTLLSEIDPKCDPLGPLNKFIICTGSLSGTKAPCTGRISVGCKSPLTGTIKEANAGGTIANAFEKLNIKAIIIEDMPNENGWYILKVSTTGCELLPADEFIKLNNYELVDEIKKKFGNKVSIASIGIAGERQYRNSTVQVTDTKGRPCRAAARGGVGAVMGSKGIKAIVIDTEGAIAERIELADAKKTSEAIKGFVKGMMSHWAAVELVATGTAGTVMMMDAMGGLPTRNYSTGTFEKAKEISGEYLVEIQKERNGTVGHKCSPGCVIGCSNIYLDKGGEYLTAGLEYETIGLVGSNCGIGSLDVIAQVDRMCDDIGLDTMDLGCSIAVCMEAGIIEFGDEEGTLKLIQEINDGTERGRILGQGAEFTGKYYNVKRIPTVKGQALSAYDPRALKGTGVTYATTPMGGDHTAGNVLGAPGVEPLSKEGQVAASRYEQVRIAAFDNLGICLFAGLCIDDHENLKNMLLMMEGIFGDEWTEDKLFEMGRNVLRLERKFNSIAGFTEEDDRLPQFMYEEPLPPFNEVFDVDQSEMKTTLEF